MSKFLCAILVVSFCSLALADEVLGPVLAIKKSVKVDMQECLKNISYETKDYITCEVKNVDTAKYTDVLAKGYNQFAGKQSHNGCGATLILTTSGYRITAEDSTGSHYNRMSDCLTKIGEANNWNKTFDIVVYGVEK